MMRMASVGVRILSALSLIALPARPVAQAQTPERLGAVHFPTTCHPAVADQFDRAVALLHSFEFGASIQAFNDVLAVDSTCAMAHWGIALSRWTNPMAPTQRSAASLQQGRASAEAAVRLAAGRASEREREYARAVSELYDDFEHRDERTRVLAYERAMNDLTTREPTDTEAMIFHAIALTATALPSDKTYERQLAAGRILERLWEREPNHPGLAHYIIHTYDVPALADHARAAAQRYAIIAPSAAHALHMPSHTFTRLGMWDESVNTNRQSMASAVTSGSIAEALHASDYAMYAYLQLGREAEARAILDSLPLLGARFDPNVITGAAPGSAGVFALAAIPARWVLERRAWTEAAALEPKATAFPYAEAMTYFARALGAVHTGDRAKASASIDSLTSIEQRLHASSDAYWAEQVAIERLGASAWLSLVDHRETEALTQMREAVAREDATEKSAVTPGPLAPARELLADMLVELGRPAEAGVEYRATLRKEPNRRRSLRGASRIENTRPSMATTEPAQAPLPRVRHGHPRAWVLTGALLGGATGGVVAANSVSAEGSALVAGPAVCLSAAIGMVGGALIGGLSYLISH
jgi:hypothetical protein